jgi:hypothetical protein
VKNETIQIGSKVKIVKTTLFGDDVIRVDSKDEDLLGQKGIVKRVVDLRAHEDRVADFQYFVETKNACQHSDGLYDFFGYELELI